LAEWQTRSAGEEGRRDPEALDLDAAPRLHGELEHLATLGYFDDGGVTLHRCRCCDRCWEFASSSWDGRVSSFRCMRPITAEQWQDRPRRAATLGMRVAVAVVIGTPTVLLVLMRLYAVLVPTADAAFRGPNPWLGLLLSVVFFLGFLYLYRLASR
jgi:hypothetical protein